MTYCRYLIYFDFAEALDSDPLPSCRRQTARNGDADIIVFRDNSSKFRLFGTNIHVTLGAVIAATVGLMVTIAFCIFYTFYHSGGQGRNEFIDHLELVDLIFAFFFGLPCHYLLFYGVHTENKRYLSPFLVFYCTNFMLNVIFCVVTIIAAIVDVRRVLLGQVRYEFTWVAFQLGFTIAQGFAIYLVLRCRKYLSAKEHWKKMSKHEVLKAVAECAELVRWQMSTSESRTNTPCDFAALRMNRV
ncbi:unnamed protein product [Toxocara canis]|uniref:DUF7027 domain-containing protein n=1 Tax=Toxocara canis TaxID=6265 RepID=A0A183V1X6_TOXCA|nr:unnamed protein product [Toxocara canis]